MKNHSPFTQTFEQLPTTLPIFPLSNAVVMPGGFLPLNIFEPRYLNMFKDAMQGDQLIGMIQPKDIQSQDTLTKSKEAKENSPSLFDIGCAARISSYQETTDGRLEVMLTGICRFQVKQEITSMRGYRIVVPDWSQYKHDYDEAEELSQEKVLQLNGALRQYFTYKKIDVNWESFSDIPTEDLLNNLIEQLPFTSQHKQILIEAFDLEIRLKSFCALLETEKSANEQSH